MAKPKPITPAEIRGIATNSDGSFVTRAFSSLGPINGYADILDSSNPADRAVCLAAEQVIHMAEGWRYFSSAMTAFLNHEFGNAIHMAYYAELRAALSLFSGAGVRIKLGDAYWLDGAGAVQPIGAHRTHDLVWRLWNEWIKRPEAKAILENNIRIEAATTLKHFESKLVQFNPGFLLGVWGYDLVSLGDDHLARNRASYTAYWRDTPLPRMTSDQLKFAKNLSELFLSSGTGLVFDRALIQYAVNETVEGTLDLSNLEDHDSDRKAKLKEIADFVARQSGADEALLLEMLSENVGKQIFEKAKQQTDGAENVLSRAAFLGRLSMLSVRQNIVSAGNGHAKKWLENWLEHCGAWEPSPGTSIQDIETDFSEALNDFPVSATSIPRELWNVENAFSTSKVSNLHACIAWGAAS